MPPLLRILWRRHFNRLGEQLNATWSRCQKYSIQHHSVPPEIQYRYKDLSCWRPSWPCKHSCVNDVWCLKDETFTHSNSCYRSFPLPKMAEKNWESCCAQTTKSYHTLSLLTSSLTHNAASSLEINGLPPLRLWVHIPQNETECSARIISRALIIRGINHFPTARQKEEQILLQSKKFGWKSQY